MTSLTIEVVTCQQNCTTFYSLCIVFCCVCVCLNLRRFVIVCLPSRLMPTAMHFFSRQYWQRLRLIRNMEHCWFLVHGLYWIFCWMLRRKKPCHTRTNWTFFIKYTFFFFCKLTQLTFQRNFIIGVTSMRIYTKTSWRRHYRFPKKLRIDLHWQCKKFNDPRRHFAEKIPPKGIDSK